MGWLKNIIIDLLVTALIVAAVTTGQEWARWVVIVYTPIMLILKLASLFGRSTIRQMKSKAPEAPHVLYAIKVVGARSRSVVDNGRALVGDLDHFVRPAEAVGLQVHGESSAYSGDSWPIRSAESARRTRIDSGTGCAAGACTKTENRNFRPLPSRP